MSVIALGLTEQLNALLRLTTVEAVTARARSVQPTTSDTRAELLANATKADGRAAAIRTAITDLGGVPDVLGIGVARALAAGRLPLEQTLPVSEALLTDLALEHQLFDRARLVKVLGHEAGKPAIVQLAERLEEAHGETIQWLFTVLAKTALGGPAALAPTSAQAAASVVRATVTYGGTVAVKAVNSTAATLSNAGVAASVKLGGAAETLQTRAASKHTTIGSTIASTVDTRREQARGLLASAARVVTAGRNATLTTAQHEASSHNAPEAALGIQHTREALGALSADELPISGYDTLTVRQAEVSVAELSEVHDIRTVLAYERAHKARATVITACEKRIRAVAAELVNS